MAGKVIFTALLAVVASSAAADTNYLPLNGNCAPAGSVCGPKLVCAGNPDKRKCVYPMPVGKRCGQDPYWVCQTGVNCVNGYCLRPRIPLGGDCAPDGAICEENLQCAGPADARVCVKALPVGERCEHEPFWVCKKELVCEDNTCKLPEDGDCSVTGSICIDGTTCFGRTAEKKCVKPTPENDACDDGPFSLCADSLECLSGKCATPEIPLGGDCSASGAVCKDTLQCAGPIDARVCVKALPVGERCEHEPFWVCKKELVCEDNTCKLPEDGDCSATGSICIDGTTCFGRTAEKKCVKPTPENDACDDGPFSLCADSLECLSGKCATSEIPLGGDCSASGAVCKDTLQCAGPTDARVCVKALPVGERCEHEPFWVCEKDLLCEENTCKLPNGAVCSVDGAVCLKGSKCAGAGASQKCVLPIEEGKPCVFGNPLSVCMDGLMCRGNVCATPMIPLGGSCMATGSVCAFGLSCAGPDDARVCVKPMPAGDQCLVEPFWVCQTGLKCENNVCKIPAKGSCTNNADDCVKSTVCAGSKDDKKCVEPAQVGKACGTSPFSVCKTGLVCENAVCKVPENGNCTASDAVCVIRAVCAGKNAEKRCVIPVPEGGNCSNSPNSVCVTGLTCQQSKCRKPLVSQGGDCTPNGSRCVAGTVCVGPSSRKRCMMPMKVGKKCNTDPYWVCKAGLSCERNICKLPIDGDCTKSGAVCVSRAVCAGTKMKKQCVLPVAEGKKCSKSPFSVCAKGLSCLRDVCRKPLVPQGGDCTPRGLRCVAGTVCVGPSNHKRCMMPMTVGKKCNTDPYWVCKAGLSCDRNICKLPVDSNCSHHSSLCVSGAVCTGHTSHKKCVRGGSIKQYHSCKGRESQCTRGTHCVGSGHKKWCYAPRSLGRLCRLPFRTCATGLSCVAHRCRKIVSVGSHCSSWKVACQSGAVCAGPWGRKRCVKPMQLGQKCATDPYWVCARGLKCMNHVCRKW